MLTGGIRLGRLFGVEIFLHPLWFIVLGLVTLQTLMASPNNMVAVAVNVVFIIALYLCVLIHEFAHIMVARKYKINTRRITINLFGGAAEIKRIPLGLKETAIAAAGPACSLVLSLLFAALLFLHLFLFGGTKDNAILTLLGGLSYINLLLVVFNLIPILPLDGGRIMRGILYHFSHRMFLATKITTISGLITFPLFVWFYFGVDVWILLIGFLIIQMSISEYMNVKRTFKR